MSKQRIHVTLLAAAAWTAFSLADAMGQSASPSPTPLPNSIVTSTCINPSTDMSVLSWSYNSGYLVCVTGDSAGAEGEALYAESPAGSGVFTLIKGVGGYFTSNDLESYGVPQSVAAALFIAVQQGLSH